jgi:hypothetical protein
MGSGGTRALAGLLGWPCLHEHLNAEWRTVPARTRLIRRYRRVPALGRARFGLYGEAGVAAVVGDEAGVGAGFGDVTVI